MNKVIEAFEAHLLAQQRERRRRQSEPANLPPMPSDPTICRWCGGKTRLLIPGDPKSVFCQNLCAPSDTAPYLNQCTDCGEDFYTGKHRADVCWACESAEKGERPNGEQKAWTRDRFGERLRGR